MTAASEESALQLLSRAVLDRRCVDLVLDDAGVLRRVEAHGLGAERRDGDEGDAWRLLAFLDEAFAELPVASIQGATIRADVVPDRELPQHWPSS